MSAHGQRAHATWSASSTDANWNCPGRLAFVLLLPQGEEESEAASWGTACHQLSERCLKGNHEPSEFIGEVEKTKTREHAVDDEMAECASVYVDYVRGRIHGTDAIYWFEQNFSLEPLNPPFDAGGTADAVIYFPSKKLLEVVDLKTGRGVVVEAVGNPQARTYSLGALLNIPMQVETIMSTIVQPRAAHRHGRIRSEVISVVDMLDWTTDLRDAMARSKEALDARQKHAEAGTLAAWSVEFLKAGDHCKFCPAAGQCPALEKLAHDAAGVWFDDLTQPHLANTPTAMTPEQLSQALDVVDMIEDWIAAVRAHAHSLAEMGTEIPNYQLVAKEGRKKWAIDDTDKLRSDLLMLTGLPQEKIETVKVTMKTPAQIEKLLGESRKNLIQNMWVKPQNGTNLVRSDKTLRPALTPVVNQFFSKIED